MMIGVKKKSKRGSIVRKSAARTKKARASATKVAQMRAPTSRANAAKLENKIDAAHQLQNAVMAYRHVLETIRRSGMTLERDEFLEEYTEAVKEPLKKFLRTLNLSVG
jgi:hypothetical protein